MYRIPHPTEPEVFDDRRELAETLYADARGYLQRGERIPPAVSAALFWIGYRIWVLPNHGFMPPETPRRRERLFRDLADKPYAGEVVRIVEALGWDRPPAREAEPKFEHLKRHLEVGEGTVEWGLASSLERPLIFGARYNLLRLRVEDGGETVFSEDRRPFDEEKWIFLLDMAAAGLTDDDYRFVLECLHDATGARSRHPFDFAIVEGDWKRLEFQGWDWDGETEGSTREHVAAERPPEPKPKPEEPPKVEPPKPDPTLLAEARANFKRRHSAQGGGADWFMTLVAYGDEPEWLASTPAPESTNIVAHLRARARLWSGWNRWVADLERIERGS